MIKKLYYVFFFITLTTICEQNKLIFYPGRLEFYPGRYFMLGRHIVENLLDKREALHQIVRSNDRYRHLNTSDTKRYVRLKFIVDNLYSRHYVRNMFGILAVCNNFNPNDNKSVENGAQIMIDLLRGRRPIL